jgi:hypothetical protein
MHSADLLQQSKRLLGTLGYKSELLGKGVEAVRSPDVFQRRAFVTWP